jgi:hypothetical protein
MQNLRQLESSLAEEIASYARDPLGFVKFAFPWKDPMTENSDGPKIWQATLLDNIGKHLRNPATRFTPYQVAVASGHGVGKSALVSLVTAWAISTCDDARIVITANSDPQLRTKTWPEVNKWFRMMINGHWFSLNAESITIKNPAMERTWRADRLTWSINNPQAFAGLHNKGKRIVVIFDEASEIDDVIWEVTEGTLTDENTEIIWLAFGNPTVNKGRFRECFGKYKHRWHPVQLDARTIEGTNKVQLDKWVEDYGEDSDFVRVRVRGEFPRAGSNQFIGSDLVQNARKFNASGYSTLPKVLAVDVARFGDDQTVFMVRQGRWSRLVAQHRGLDLVQVARKIVEAKEDERPDYIVVDGDGLGAGVVDTLRSWGHEVTEFHGSQTPNDVSAYYNRRAEIWGLMRDWLKAGAQITDDPFFAEELVGVQYGLSSKQQIQLEKKSDMKKRGLSSPDMADALAMTFAIPLAANMPVNKKQVRYVYPSGNEQSWMA